MHQEEKRMETKKKLNIMEFISKYSLYIELVIVIAVFAVLTNGLFVSTRNLSNLMMQGVTCSIIAITMMSVIVSKNCDLSAGFGLGFMCTFAAKAMVDWNLSSGVTIILVLFVGLLIGLWHGFFIAYLHLPAFIVTLASQLLFQGLILVVGQGFSIGPVKETFSIVGRDYVPGLGLAEGFNDTSAIIAVVLVLIYIVSSVLARKRKIKEGCAVPPLQREAAKWVGVSAIILTVSAPMILYRGYPFAILFLALCCLAMSYVIKNTPYGRYVFAIGGNPEAAKYSGINIEKNVMLIYIIHSMVLAVASIVYLGRVGQASASSGTGFEFTAITGCVVGGTSILGGRGNVLGAIIGTMLMAGLDNGMSLLNLGAAYQYLIKGLVLMFAIALDVLGKKN